MSNVIDAEALLLPVHDDCPPGEDLEYDGDFLALVEKLETACEAGANQQHWQEVAERAKALLRRTKDLRVAVALVRALVVTDGWIGFRDSLKLLAGLFDRYWAVMHPKLENSERQDEIEWRLNILMEWVNPAGLIRDLRRAPLLKSRDGVIVTLTELEDEAHDSGSPPVELGSATYWDRGDSPIDEVMAVLRESMTTLQAIMTLLRLHTGERGYNLSSPLVEVLGRAERLVSRKRAPDSASKVTPSSLDTGITLSPRGHDDFAPEGIADQVPEFRKLTADRARLRELIDGMQMRELREFVEKNPRLREAIEQLKEKETEAGGSEPAAPRGPHAVQPSVSVKPPYRGPDNGYLRIPHGDVEQGLSASSLDNVSTPIDDNVQFTVYRPRSLVAGVWTTMLAFAHLSERRPDASSRGLDPVEEVARQAASVLGERISEYQSLSADSTEALPAQSLISFIPHATGVEFNPTSRSFHWVEAVHREEFRMCASASPTGQRARGHLSVFLGSILIAEVSLNFRILALGETASREAAVEVSHAQRYRKIFPSYAHADLAIVEQLEHYARAIGDSYLRDVTTLRAGEVWDERLGQLIAEADVFQLFWSNRSMVSPFVRTEWERALALDRSNFVRPVYWEGPLPRRPEEDLPPPSLSRVHFQFIGTRSYQPSPEHVARVVIGPTVGSDRTTPQPTQLGGSATNRISSGKGVLFKVRGPRVHLTYPAETYRSQGKLELPFVTGIFADLTGKQDRGHGLKNVHSLR